jgi:hypothetical protein
MKFKDLLALAKAGAPVAVECKSGVNRWDGCYPETGMRLEVTGGRIDEPDVARIEVDYALFDEFNKAFESSDYRDKNGDGVLTARQAGWYKVQEFLYVDPEEEIDSYFTILADERKSLVEAYAALPEPKSTYVAWLEQRLLSNQVSAVAATSQVPQEQRICVHVDNYDGNNVLVTLAPAKMSKEAADTLVQEVWQAADSDYGKLEQALQQHGFSLLDCVTVDIDR